MDGRVITTVCVRQVGGMVINNVDSSMGGIVYVYDQVGRRVMQQVVFDIQRKKLASLKIGHNYHYYKCIININVKFILLFGSYLLPLVCSYW